MQDISISEKTVIIYESPHKFKKLLKELKRFCGGNRKILVTRELTKKFEQHIESNIDEVLMFFQGKEIIGEFTLVIEGIRKEINKENDYSNVKNDLHDLVNSGLSLSAASKYLSKKTKLTRNLIYSLYLK